MAIHSSVLTWRIPEMGESGGLSSMWSHRVGHDRSDLAAADFLQETEERSEAAERGQEERADPRGWDFRE